MEFLFQPHDRKGVRHQVPANRRRGELIDKKIRETITENELTELNQLQFQIEDFLDRETPVSLSELEKAEALLESHQAVEESSSGTK